MVSIHHSPAGRAAILRRPSHKYGLNRPPAPDGSRYFPYYLPVHGVAGLKDFRQRDKGIQGKRAGLLRGCRKLPAQGLQSSGGRGALTGSKSQVSCHVFLESAQTQGSKRL